MTDRLGMPLSRVKERRYSIHYQGCQESHQGDYARMIWKSTSLGRPFRISILHGNLGHCADCHVINGKEKGHVRFIQQEKTPRLRPKSPKIPGTNIDGYWIPRLL